MKKYFVNCSFRVNLPKIEITEDDIEIEITLRLNGCVECSTCLERIIIKDADDKVVMSGKCGTVFNLKDSEQTKRLACKNVSANNDMRDYTVELYFLDELRNVYVDVYYEIRDCTDIRLYGINTYEEKDDARIYDLQLENQRLKKEISDKDYRIAYISNLNQLHLEERDNLQNENDKLKTELTELKKKLQKINRRNSEIKNKNYSKYEMDYSKSKGFKEAIEAANKDVYNYE